MTIQASIKILTYNIHKGFSLGNTRFVLGEIRDAVRSEAPDIFCVQEVHGERLLKHSKPDEFPGRAHFEFLADDFFSHYSYGKNAVYPMGHHGNAILSRFCILETKNINVSNYRRASRSLLHSVVEEPLSKKRIHVICIHLGLFEAERARQVRVLCDRIESHVPHDEPLIVAGDFNDWAGKVERYFRSELNLKEIFKISFGNHACTFPAMWPFLTLDRIYFRGLIPGTCHCPGRQSQWSTLSDHLPLAAQFFVGT